MLAASFREIAIHGRRDPRMSVIDRGILVLYLETSYLPIEIAINTTQCGEICLAWVGQKHLPAGLGLLRSSHGYNNNYTCIKGYFHLLMHKQAYID